MDRLFLDANILFSAAYRPGAGLLQFWKLSGVALCSSRYALEEARINLSEGAQMHRLNRLARSIQFFDAASRPHPEGLSLPEKDWPILLAALEAQAPHLISGDFRHFGPYFGRTMEGILVRSPAKYLKSRRLK